MSGLSPGFLRIGVTAASCHQKHRLRNVCVCVCVCVCVGGADEEVGVKAVRAEEEEVVIDGVNFCLEE